MQCRNCGNAIRPEWRFCPHCRAAVQAGAEPSDEEKDASLLPELVPTPTPLAARPSFPSDLAGAYRDSLAVVIGVAEYAHRRVPMVTQDVRDFLDVLHYLDFPPERICTLTDKQANQTHLNQYLTSVLPARIKPESRLIIFFAGLVHDYMHTGGYLEPMLLPHGADAQTASRLGISVQTIFDALASVQLYHCLMIVDACSSGFCAIGNGNDHFSHDLVVSMAKGAFDLIVAAQSDQMLLHLRTRSLFMEMLLRGIGGEATDAAIKAVTGRSLGDFISRKVAAASVNRQTPAYRRVAGMGSVFLIPYAEGAHAPSTAVLSAIGGKLTVTSEPSEAFVILNGRIQGTTPIELSIAPGEYDIKVACPQYQTYHTRFHFTGRDSSLHVPLEHRPKCHLPKGLTALTSEHDAASALPLRVIRVRDQAEMVLVPPGRFVMGFEKGPQDERPAHIINLAAFYIDRYAVTNEAYELCMRATGAQRPLFWKNHNYENSRQPVVGISYEDALKYAEWAGAQLPTEAQWEKAAKGTQERYFPWGNTVPTAKIACFLDSHETEGPVPVDCHPTNVSPYGAEQMVGNVWEWCLDWYDAGYYLISPKEEPQGPEFGTARVVRGGAWNSKRGLLRCTCRGHRPPDYRGPDVGLRCVVRCGRGGLVDPSV